MFAVILSRLSPVSRLTAARRLVALTVAAGAIGLAACDDPFAPRATTRVRIDSFLVYSMSQTPVTAPAAFNILLFTPLRLEPTYGYDIVFDLDASGNVVILPVRLVGGAVTAGRSVGLQKIQGSYEDVTRAPTRGYQYDSTVTLAVNEGVLVELPTDACQFQTSRVVYAKLQISAADPVSRRIAFRIAYDPNCGFRSFLPGIPKD
ncbi:MAG: hypothetical protein HUU26_11400 [Gemmatimonadaceae bacterium]|nr:hypothetical protein [Gemmatimonadaceae bacterium]